MNEEKIQELINDNPIIQRLSKDAVGHAFNKVTSGFTCVGELPEMASTFIRKVMDAYEAKTEKLVQSTLSGKFWEISADTDRPISDIITEAVTKFYNQDSDLSKDKADVVKLFLETVALRLLLQTLVRLSICADVTLKSQPDHEYQV